MKIKRIVSLLLVLVLAVSAIAVLGSCKKEEKKKTDNITVQIGPNPETLDPALNSAVDGGNMLITLFETLLIIDKDNKVQPGQAESYTVSPDGLTWTFTMRDGLKWSDGTELNAKDFEYTMKRITDPNVGAPYGSTVVGMIEGYLDAAGNPDEKGKPTTKPDRDKLNVKASEDGKTLTIKLAYPCSYFDKIVAFGTMSPVQKATVEKNGDKWATKPETYVCNGPYMISEWTPGEKIICKKNPNYKGGWDNSKIVTEQLTFLLLEDSAASYAAYTSGQALMIKDVPTEEIPSLKKAADGGDFYVDTNLGTYYLSMNNQKAPFNNVNVRKALSLVIDREYVANTIMQGTYTPAYDFVGPGIVDNEGMFIDNSIAANGGSTYISKDYQANVAEAKKALAEAGYPDGKGFPTITYSTNDAGYHKALAEYLQQVYKKELGIEMKIDTVDWSSFTPQRRAGNYEMARNGWVMDYNDASNISSCSIRPTATTTASTTARLSTPLWISPRSPIPRLTLRLFMRLRRLCPRIMLASPLHITTTSGSRARLLRAFGTAPMATGTSSMLMLRVKL